MLKDGIAEAEKLDIIEKESIIRVKDAKKKAWKNFITPLKKKRDDFLKIVDASTCNCLKPSQIEALKKRPG